MQRLCYRTAAAVRMVGVSRRSFGSLKDAAARAMVNQALDSIASGRTNISSGSSATEPATSADVAFDALTWKSIVDRPIVADADQLRSTDLYPDHAPSLDALASQKGGSAVASFPFDESADQLNLAAFPGAADVDPFSAVGAELRNINGNIKALLGIDHPVLATVAKYFFDFEGGKKVRPALVLLMAHAVNHHMSALQGASYTESGRVALTHEQVVSGQDVVTAGIPALQSDAERKPLPAQVVLPLQRRLAEITELIHTASLLHDDVIDSADTRRGVSSVNAVFGNKLAVLAGDFLLARASVCLARLRNVPVVELLSSVIEHLVKGEVMQMKQALRSEAASRAAFDMYLRKTYYKTGSLMANSCKAIALLGCYPDAVCDASFRYGMHLGIAFQLIDDLLDFEGTAASLGKPALADLQQGLATAPVLFAAQRFPNLIPLIERKFGSPGDVALAMDCVGKANGLLLTRRLAIAHGQLALDSLAPLHASPARTALAALVSRVLNRTR